MSDDRDKLNAKNFVAGVSMPVGVPPHPPSKKVAIPDHSREGFEEID